MLRKLALMFAVGVCCSLVGTFQFPVFGSDKCQDMEVSAVICPIKIYQGHPMIHKCRDLTSQGEWSCEDPNWSPTDMFKMNTYQTTPKVGNRTVPEIVMTPLGPGVATTLCYRKHICAWDPDLEECRTLGLENVMQFIYNTERCPVRPPDP